MILRSNRFKVGLLLLVLLLPLTQSCNTDTEDPSFDNPFDPILGDDLPKPDSVTVAVGDNIVRLRWALPEGESADEYAVFRKTTTLDSEEDERLLDRVSGTEFTDTRVRNGRTYAYRIAAGVGGRFGRRTEEFDAKPGLFSILLSQDEPRTRERVVSVSFTAPSAEAIRLSEDSGAFGSPWHPTSGSVQWTLSAEDGEKIVYGQFRFPDGSISLPVHDTIELDAKAVIRSVSFDGPDTRTPGESVHFRIITEEPDGSATIQIAGIFDSVPLFDDGSLGDLAAGDGTYERDLVIPAMATALDKQVKGAFTDEAGNVAAAVIGSRLLSVREKPEPITLMTPITSEPPDEPSVTLRWDRSVEEDFSSYKIFRGESAPVDSTSRLIGTIDNAGTLEHEDKDVIEGKTFFYRTYVEVESGSQVGSNIVQASIPNVRPPAPSTIETPTASSSTKIGIEWSRCEDLDFLSYRLYRNESGAVSEDDQMIAEINDVDRIFWDDQGLRENTDYYYRVYTLDHIGLSARSNEVEATTKNEPPSPVQLSEAADIDTTAVTLSWSESSAHDFEFYRLYRDTIATVTTSSTLVVELDDQSFTSFRDEDLERGTRYYYRVFIFDDADDPKTSGSNTVSFMTPDTLTVLGGAP